MPANFELIASAISEGREAVEAFKAGKRFTALEHVGSGLEDVGQFGRLAMNEDGAGPQPVGSGASRVTEEVSRIYGECRGDTAEATVKLLDRAEEVMAEVQADEQGQKTAIEVGGPLDKRPILAALVKAALTALLQALVL